ncbi:S9 family peptidase [Candidatus Hodarchaeum mangrovi]
MNLNEKKILPPKATIKPHKMINHGTERVDNYYWLREKENAEVIEYLKAENVYTDKMMDHTKLLQKKLFKEMKGRIKEDDVSTKEKHRNYYYYWKTFKGKQYRAYYRNTSNDSSSATHEELLLDENKEAEGLEYYKLGFFKVSPNDNFLAYSVDTSGAEEFVIYFKDLITGELFPETIQNTSYTFAWGGDNKTVYYTTLNPQKQPDKVYKHVLGTDPSIDELLYQEKDEQYYLKLNVSNDYQYLFLTLSSKNTSEIHFLPLTEGRNQKFTMIHPRDEENELEYYLEHQAGKFLILTNLDNAENFKLMQTDIDTPSINNWEEIIPHRKEVYLIDIVPKQAGLVLYERIDGIKKIRVLANNFDYYIDFPDEIYTTWKPIHLQESLVNPVYSSPLIQFNYTSLTNPTIRYEYDILTKSLHMLKQEEVLGYKPEEYRTKRLISTAEDGSEIFISLVHHKGIVPKSDQPLLLYGYGSYGYTIDPQFLSTRISLLNRGIIYAIAHIRGGSSQGRPWYENGKLLAKKNTFTDFIACAEYLINEGWTSKEKLIIMGGSAGGLLLGVVINMRPELFKGAVVTVPFVDVVTTMFDETIPLTVLEYLEWGNPNDKEYFDFMLSYSPYDNVEPKVYPHLLVTAGLNDPRVQYWEPAKWVAKLRILKTDNNLLLLKTNMGAGHAGKSGRYDYLKEIALYYAFFLDILGIDN